MKTLNELQPLIIFDWATPKGLIKEENASQQRLKLIEECGELSSAILKKDVAKQKDAIGDIFVVLVILQAQYSEKYTFEIDDSPFYNDIDTSLINLIDNATYSESIDVSFSWLLEAALSLKLDLTECANLAWNEIKNRTGQTVNGTFIKD